MNWFIRTILFFVFMLFSYYFVLPNVVLSGIISLLLVNAITNTSVVYAIMDSLTLSSQKNNELHWVIADLQKKIRELEDEVADLKAEILHRSDEEMFEEG